MDETITNSFKWWEELNTYRQEKQPFLTYQWKVIVAVLDYLSNNKVDICNSSIRQVLMNCSSSYQHSIKEWSGGTMYYQKMISSLIPYLDDRNSPQISNYLSNTKML